MITETYVLEITSFSELKCRSWGGAIQTLERIEELNKQDELIEYLNAELATNEHGIEATTLNDFLWFDTDFIERELNIKLWEE